MSLLDKVDGKYVYLILCQRTAPHGVSKEFPIIARGLVVLPHLAVELPRQLSAIPPTSSIVVLPM